MFPATAQITSIIDMELFVRLLTIYRIHRLPERKTNGNGKKKYLKRFPVNNLLTSAAHNLHNPPNFGGGMMCMKGGIYSDFFNFPMNKINYLMVEAAGVEPASLPSKALNLFKFA
jgi:hypothetical protein